VKYSKRLGVAWLASSVVLMMHTLAATPWSVMTARTLALLLVTALGCGLVASAIGAAMIRNNIWTAMLVAQVLTIVMVRCVWLG